MTNSPTTKPMTRLEKYEYQVRIRYERRFGRALPDTDTIKTGIREFFEAGISANDAVSACHVEVQLTKRSRS